MRIALEQLEARRLMSVGIVYTPDGGRYLDVQGTTASDKIYIERVVRSSAPGDAEICVTVNGVRSTGWAVTAFGNIVVHAGKGNDIVTTSKSSLDKTIEAFGESGKDSIQGNTWADKLLGGPGNDTVYGGTGDDRLEGGTGNDLLVGQDGNDSLFAGQGADSLYGGNGNDYMNAFDSSTADPNDLLDGGAGADFGNGNIADTIFAEGVWVA